MAKKRRRSLKFVLISRLLLGISLLGVLILGVVYFFVSTSLKAELIQRGFSVGSTIAKTSGHLILDEDKVLLNQRVNDAKEFQSLSYVIIENEFNEVLSSTFRNVPPEVAAVVRNVESQDISKIDTLITYTHEGNLETVYEILCPVEEGIVGYVRIGMYKKFVDAEVNNTLIFILIVIVLALILGVMGAYIMASNITQPLIYLKESADKISMGEIDTSIGAQSNDEIGDLSDAIERMRESLKAAIERLKKRSSMRV